MAVGYKISSGDDLDLVFNAGSGGTACGFLDSSGNDLNTHYAPLSKGSAAAATAYKDSSGNDLNTLYAGIGTVPTGTFYMSSTQSTIITTSDQFVLTAPSGETSATTTITNNGNSYVRILARGGASNPTAAIPTANGAGGFFYDAGLAGLSVANRNFTVKVTLTQNTSITITIYATLYIRNGSTYTLFNSNVASTTLNHGVKTTLTMSSTQSGAYTFAAGDTLWLLLYASTASYPSSTIILYNNNGANYELTTSALS